MVDEPAVARIPVSTIDDLPLTIYESEQLCQILNDDIRRPAAVSGARTTPCKFRSQLSARIARSPACNTESAQSVAITRAAR